jgi:acyl carrier protein
MNEIKEALRRYVLENSLKGESSENLKDTTPLQSSGILDSLALLGLITYMEKQYHIELTAIETGVSGFDSLNDMAALIEKKRTS